MVAAAPLSRAGAAALEGAGWRAQGEQGNSVPKLHQKGYFQRFFFRCWTVKTSSGQPVPLITTNISWAQVKRFKLPTAKPELPCQLGVKGKIVPCHLKLSFSSSQTNPSEMEQNNSKNVIILPRTTDQWTIRGTDASHKQYQVFLTSVGEG